MSASLHVWTNGAAILVLADSNLTTSALEQMRDMLQDFPRRLLVFDMQLEVVQHDTPLGIVTDPEKP